MICITVLLRSSVFTDLLQRVAGSDILLDYLFFADIRILANSLKSVIQELACLLPLISFSDASLDLLDQLPMPMDKLLGSFALLESFDLTFDQVWDEIHYFRF